MKTIESFYKCQKIARFKRALVELNHQISNSRKRAARNHEESRVFTQPLRTAVMGRFWANDCSGPEAILHLHCASRLQHFRQTPRPSRSAAVQRQKWSFVLAAASITDAMTAEPPFGLSEFFAIQNETSVDRAKPSVPRTARMI